MEPELRSGFMAAQTKSWLLPKGSSALRLLSLPAILVSALFMAGCPDAVVQPEPITFAVGNSARSAGFYTTTPDEYKIVEQRIAGDVNSRFTFMKKCAGETLVGRRDGYTACQFEIRATGLLAGESATLETLYEYKPPSIVKIIRTTLEG
jgi:hypothetical protein